MKRNSWIRGKKKKIKFIYGSCNYYDQIRGFIIYLQSTNKTPVWMSVNKNVFNEIKKQSFEKIPEYQQHNESNKLYESNKLFEIASFYGVKISIQKELEDNEIIFTCTDAYIETCTFVNY